MLTVNQIEVLNGTDEAYASMLSAIASATETIYLSTYQFDRDQTGEHFVACLEEASARGVQIKVLIDHLGALLHWPTVERNLRRARIAVEMFNPVPGWRRGHSHIRYHRKLLTVDGRVGFTGGMNIMHNSSFRPFKDVHFRMEGPIVQELQAVFALDWKLCAEEDLKGTLSHFHSDSASIGGIAARVVANHPRRFNHIRKSLLRLIGSARRSLRIVTPFFVPDGVLMTSLTQAIGRGVEIEIFTPAKNFPLVAWASKERAHTLARRGCRVLFTSAPFDHSKILLVDGAVALIGSSNWDARSLRSNLELNVECRSVDLSDRLDFLIGEKTRNSHDLDAVVESSAWIRAVKHSALNVLSQYL